MDSPSNTCLGLQISIDRGGTFTDVYACLPGKEDIVLKVLSEDPANYPDALTEAIRRVVELATGKPHPRGQPIDMAPISRIRMGTTVGTNALLERKGARTALLITKGFKDMLLPGLLYDDVVEVDERVTFEGYAEGPDPDTFIESNDPDLVAGITGETVRILKRPDLQSVRESLLKLWDDGYQSVAIVLLHSYIYPEHEKQVGRLACEIGFSVVESAALQPMIRAVPRGMSAAADAYLTPVIKKYIDSIAANFKDGLAVEGLRCEFMQSDGGLVSFENFGGLRSILSGPAGGVVGYAQTSWDEEQRKPVIGFDMGGTSTDCSRYAGTYEHVFETITSSVSIQAPQLDIITVAAGGGSMLKWQNGLFQVGPESSGAHPGPACYRKGGPLTVTDANLYLGRIVPDHFPKIFGPNEDETLGTEIVIKLFDELTAQINDNNALAGGDTLTSEAVALGFLRVATEVMARPIRALTEVRGFDTSKHMLSCFGGAGGQHACDLGNALSIRDIVIHKHSSILSAYGLSLADVVHEVQRPAAVTLERDTYAQVANALDEMANEAVENLRSQGLETAQIRCELYLNLRYEGSNSSSMIMQESSSAHDISKFRNLFESQHSREFGFVFPEKKVLIDDFRVQSIGSATKHNEASLCKQFAAVKSKLVDSPAPEAYSKVWFDAASGGIQTPLFSLPKLVSGTRLKGPALILDKTQTILVCPGTEAFVLDSLVMIKAHGEANSTSSVQSEEINPIHLSIFGHRFMSIAEQMGRTLQKTSVSTNIKERLDFSCAIFSPDGSLVANAPHVPVHLGSMQFCVKHMHKMWKGRLDDGDVLWANTPSSGGTHLPDITVVTPVFEDGEIVFYVASRGHHADIGGISPGSMPPNSRLLAEEGAMIFGEKLISKGRFNEERVVELLLHEPAKIPKSSGTRGLSNNLSDLKAQVAANKQGITLIYALVKEHTLKQVHKYMYAIQENAEHAVRDLLKSFHARYDGAPLRAVDYMDDGTPIALTVTIDGSTGSAIFDFDGTGPQVYGNTNAPTAITHSAIIYCLRSLIASNIPLNQGCLSPIDIRVLAQSILAPEQHISVVGGNVLTSQRITDVILSAFSACADSQGCMNNLTFGLGGSRYDEATGEETVEAGFGYYETIGGGAGAGPTWQGTSGVHTHMTNTRITDPEVFEKRYPVLLHEFSIRKGSGGKGHHAGGDGLVRDIEFRVPGIQVSVLSERRARAPKGSNGGEDGAMGQNLWIRAKDGSTVNFGAKATATFSKGDRIILKTPGGGGWGSA